MIHHQANTVALVGVANDLGAEARGSSQVEQVLELTAHALSSVGVKCVPPHLVSSLTSRADNTAEIGPPYYVKEISALADSVFAVAFANIAESRLFILLGGDHSSNIGAVRAAAQLADVQNGLALLWIDSHPDLNTLDTSPSGRVHGMTLAAILGLEPALSSVSGPSKAVAPANVHIFGVQSIDPLEEANLYRSGVGITMLSEIRQSGVDACLSPVLNRFSNANLSLYLSIDLDVLDPIDCPSVNAPCISGLRISELMAIIRAASAELAVVAADIVEYNSARDSVGLAAGLVADIAVAIASANSL